MIEGKNKSSFEEDALILSEYLMRALALSAIQKEIWTSSNNF